MHNSHAPRISAARNDNVVEFESIASSGTKTLMLFYCWFMQFNKLTFLVIDEYDAYYHHELSEKILDLFHLIRLPFLIWRGHPRSDC